MMRLHVCVYIHTYSMCTYVLCTYIQYVYICIMYIHTVCVHTYIRGVGHIAHIQCMHLQLHVCTYTYIFCTYIHRRCGACYIHACVRACTYVHARNACGLVTAQCGQLVQDTLSQPNAFTWDRPEKTIIIFV